MSHSSDSISSQFFLRPINPLDYTDPQPGGKKVGESILSLTHATNPLICTKQINSVIETYHSRDKSTFGILFDTFDGDVAANFGKIGAAYAYQAYMKGFCNLYATDGKRMMSTDYGLHQIKAHRIVLLGQVISFELQRSVEAICESDEGQRSLEGNKKLSELC